jgi:hypothetical protein
VIITAERPGEQPCWSEPWTRFSARTGPAAAAVTVKSATRNPREPRIVERAVSGGEQVPIGVPAGHVTARVEPLPTRPGGRVRADEQDRGSTDMPSPGLRDIPPGRPDEALPADHLPARTGPAVKNGFKLGAAHDIPRQSPDSDLLGIRAPRIYPPQRRCHRPTGSRRAGKNHSAEGRVPASQATSYPGPRRMRPPHRTTEGRPFCWPCEGRCLRWCPGWRGGWVAGGCGGARGRWRPARRLSAHRRRLEG